MSSVTVSQMQMDILRHVALGYPTRNIVQLCCLNEQEYRETVSDLKRLFKARNLQEAVVIAYQAGLLRWELV